MKITASSIPIWSVVPALLAIETAVCAGTAAAALDLVVRRPQTGGGSITTLLPGFVYAIATVMKVCVVSAMVSLAAGLAWRVFARGPSARFGAGLPVWGLASIAAPPATPLVGTLAVLMAQGVGTSASVLSAGHFTHVARSGVFVMLAVLLAGALAAATSWVLRERPRVFSIVGLVLNLVPAGLFWYFRFYAIGFDQDRWAPR